MIKPLLQNLGNISKGRTIRIRGVSLFSIFQSNQRTTISKIVSQIFYRIVTNNRLSVPIGWGGHHDAWPKLREALSNDTPDYALFISWGILEKEVLNSKESPSLKKIGDGRNISICELVSKRMNYSQSKKRMLIESMKLRNKIAHGGDAEVDWQNVNAILAAAYDFHNSL
tara:strand:- start:66 stop:575 length:510 start_codon:yes stop_codon:yes gene_type:complete